MWYPVSDTVGTEPIGLDEAEAQVMSSEGDFHVSLDMALNSARSQAEQYCNRQFALHDMVWRCDSFADFARLPAAPAVEIESITYTDVDGAVQTLAAEVYELRADGLDPSIALQHGETWPAIRTGSRITVTGTFGGDVPPDVRHAMLIMIADAFGVRESAARPAFTTVDALLANHRRGAW